MRFFTRFTFLLLAINLLACAGKYRSELKFNAEEPLRVAVLPFVAVDDSGQVVEQEGRLIVDNLGLISSEVEETPAQSVRKAVITELKKSKLDLISTAAIDIDLPHRGYANSDGTLNTKKLLQTSAVELCQVALSCDAILQGRIKRWSRSYYGLQSVNTVGLELSLISAKDNSVLFFSEGLDSDSRGLSKIPTGFSSLVIEPLRGLDSEIIAELSSTVVKKMLIPLTEQKNKKSLTSSPPAIYASSHDGQNRKISLSSPLIVIVFGSESSKGFLRLGDNGPKVPLLEVYPGHYYGELIPNQGEQIDATEVTVGLVDSFGRATYATASGGKVSF